MPSKLRKAIGAVKDHTSISLAKVINSATPNLEVAVLKATSHDEVPIDERYVNEILLLISTNKSHASAGATAISRRIARTRNWIVAVKTLTLVLRISQSGDHHFPHHILRSSKTLNLSTFRDDSTPGAWDFTAFVRTFALYLDDRLDCFLAGKFLRRRPRSNSPVRDMKPLVLLDRISCWQKLLDRAIGTRPTGVAKTNRLVKISLYAVVRESFDLYRDVSDGLALLLDSFFHLQYQSCVSAFQACVKASKQFEELCSFYTLCKSIGVGRPSEYPSVQKISNELIETLQEFLKDQVSFSAGNGRSPAPQLHLSPPERSTERDSDIRSSLGDIITSPSVSLDHEPCMEQTQREDSVSEVETYLVSFDDDEQQKDENTVESNESWELELVEAANPIVQNGFDPSSLNGFELHHNNPFLEDTTEITAGGIYSPVPTFEAPPTFCAETGYEKMAAIQNEDDLFGSCSFEFCSSVAADEQLFSASGNQQNLLYEQQQWLSQQNKIIAKHIT